MRSCGIALSHGLHIYGHTSLPHVLPRTHIPKRCMIKVFKMSSKTGEKEQWPALLVRETFFDFFKKNGHTLGQISFSSQGF